MNRNLLLAILFLSLAVLPIVRTQTQRIALGMKPLDLSFTADDGSQVNLASLRGKVVLVDFWATWCPSCMEEAPTVVTAYNTMHAKGFEVVGISLDQDRNQMESVTRERGMAWPQYFDGKGWSNDIARRYGIHAIPTMWLIDKNGKLVDTNGRENLQDKVAKLLAE